MTPKTIASRLSLKGFASAKAIAAAVNAPQPAAVRRQAAIEGLERYARRFERSGEPKTAEKIRKLALDASIAMEKYDQIERELSKPKPNPVGEAQAVAVAELKKVLPKCFPTDGDARAFVCKLPLLDAFRAGEAQVTEIVSARREQKKIEKDFWKLVADGGCLALGTNVYDESIAAVVEAGL